MGFGTDFRRARSSGTAPVAQNCRCAVGNALLPPSPPPPPPPLTQIIKSARDRPVGPSAAVFIMSVAAFLFHPPDRVRHFSRDPISRRSLRVGRQRRAWKTRTRGAFFIMKSAVALHTHTHTSVNTFTAVFSPLPPRQRLPKTSFPPLNSCFETLF